MIYPFCGASRVTGPTHRHKEERAPHLCVTLMYDVAPSLSHKWNARGLLLLSAPVVALQAGRLVTTPLLRNLGFVMGWGRLMLPCLGTCT